MATKSTGPGGVIAQGVQTANPGGGTTNYSYYSHFDLLDTTGDPTPNYYRRLRAGELLPLNYFDQRETHCTTYGSWDLTLSGTTYSAETLIPTNYFPNGWDNIIPSWSVFNAYMDMYPWERYVQAAQAALYAGGWDALTFIVEFKKVIQMFKQLTSKLINLLTSTNPKDWANAWLEGRYGWRVLLYDIADINEVIEGLNDLEHAFYKQRVGGTFNHVDEGTVALIASSSWSGDWQFKNTFTVGVRGSAISKMEPPEVRFNVITTAWERVPFSFVVDWFFSIGTALEAMSGSVFQPDARLSYGYYIKCTNECTITNVQTLGSWTGTVTGGSKSTRILNTRNPTEPTYLPQFLVNLDSLKIVDLLALTLQRLSGGGLPPQSRR